MSKNETSLERRARRRRAQGENVAVSAEPSGESQPKPAATVVGFDAAMRAVREHMADWWSSLNLPADPRSEGYREALEAYNRETRRAAEKLRETS